MNPIVASMLRPSRMAHMLAPEPRWATTTRDAPARPRQLPGDVFVGQAVEAVAADAVLGHRAGDGIKLRKARLGSMERGVEAGDLRQSGNGRGHRLDRREIVRLVQRRKTGSASRYRR